MQPQHTTTNAATPEGWRSVSINATTRQPDNYLLVNDAGDARLDGKPLTEVSDADVRAWAEGAVADFQATGKQAPVPG